MSSHPAIKEMNQKMAKAVEHSLHEFNTLHTGKASPTMVEGIMVEVYGSMMRLKEVAAITTPDARMIQVQPWDKAAIKPIEKAIQTSNLGINPSVDGPVIRLPLPELSRERRQELAKVCQRMAEEGRVSVRHARRDALDALKKAQKDGTISEDDLKRFEKEVQHQHDAYIKDLDQHLHHKEQELMAV
jgi:ribosome recycling factor